MFTDDSCEVIKQKSSKINNTNNRGTDRRDKEDVANDNKLVSVYDRVNNRLIEQMDELQKNIREDASRRLELEKQKITQELWGKIQVSVFVKNLFF